MKVKFSMSITRLSLRRVCSLSLGSCLREMNMAFVSECESMFSTSSWESSGSIGTATLPKETIEKKAMLQWGIFSESMATLSLAPIPKVDRMRERLSQLSLN